MRIKELREHYKMQQKELASIVGISPNTLSQYENGKREIGYDVLSKIADHFNVSTDFIYGRTNIVSCKCGLTYCPLLENESEIHDLFHRRWENAPKKFGRIYATYAENEDVKATNREIVNDSSRSLVDRYSAQLEVFRCLFSRSLSASNYNETHVDFATYVSMLLNQPHFQKTLDQTLYDKLVEEYGVSAGIPSGTYYENISDDTDLFVDSYSHTETDIVKKYRDLDDHGKEMVDMVLDKEHARVTSKVIPLSRPTTIAAHFDGDEFTEDELDEIREFTESVKNKEK